MLQGTVRTYRYVRSWRTGANVEVRQTEIDRDGTAVEATLVLPRDAQAPLPGWVALGGVSRMGRFHPQLVRFAESLAASGAAVLIPELPEWRRLQVSAAPVAPTLRGSLAAMAANPAVRPGKVGLIGFSFGAPQVAIAASRPEIADQVAGIVLFGGYCSLERTLACQFTGDHDWDGETHSLDPDPYGRWVVGANHLTAVPGYEDAGEVAQALTRLARAASEKRISAWEPYHDPMIRELEAALPERFRDVFRLFATPTDERRPDKEPCLELARDLAAACHRSEAQLEPAAFLGGVTVPTRLIHGRGDRLIPFTECARLTEGLAPDVRNGSTVTGLFAHSADRSEGSVLERTVEKAAFLGTLRGLITTV